MNEMAFARMVSVQFKPGKREEAIERIDDAPGGQEDVRGFRGIHAFLSLDDPNVATLVTLRDADEALNASRDEIFQRVMKDLEPFIDVALEVMSDPMGR